MLPLRYPVRWHLAGLLLLAVVMTLALLPAVWPFFLEPGDGFGGLDKWLHGATFALLAAWYAGQFQRRYYWGIALALASYGLAIEAGQSIVVYRTAEWGDLAADFAGIGVGLSLAYAGIGGWSLRAEDWLGSRDA